MSSVLDRPENKPGTGKAKLRSNALDLFYGTFQALKNVNVEIGEREITALIGPSGCGKSTFLRTFNRMNDTIGGVRVKGQVMVDDLDINSAQTDVVELRKRVGMVFQKPNPFPKSIFENVVYGPRIHGERNKARLNEIAEHTLRKASLWDEVKDKLHGSALALSGGQQQRLCIARCLAVEPDVLLMDEPTSALDPNATLRIEELILELKRDCTVLIVTHNMQQAARVSDKTGFFLMGELVEFGPTKGIFGAPQDSRTSDYVNGRFG